MPLNLPAELDRLASELMEYAREGLSREGEIYPIGAGITSVDQIEWCAVSDTADDAPSITDEITSLIHGMAADAQSGKFVATGVLCQAKVSPPGAHEHVDAVEMRLDHRRGDSLRVYVPFAIGSGGVSFRQLFASDGDSSMFRDRLLQIRMDNG